MMRARGDDAGTEKGGNGACSFRRHAAITSDWAPRIERRLFMFQKETEG
jgi:hypothetical protein